jgi:hypothetical protein
MDLENWQTRVFACVSLKVTDKHSRPFLHKTSPCWGYLSRQFDSRLGFVLISQEVSMRRVIVTALCAASFLFMIPEPAHAWWDWIDQLSGPGPFQGFDLQWRVVCVEDDKVTTTNSPDPGKEHLRSLKSFGPPDPETGELKTLGAKLRVAGALAAGAGCLNNFNISPASSFNFRIARYWSTSNHLEYPSDAKVPTVNMWQYESSYSTFVDDAKLVELTVGMGASVLFGENFDSMTRFYVKPVMLTFTPGGRLTRSNLGNKLARSLSVSTGAIYMPKGFHAENFGSVGTYRTDHELLLTASASLDLSRF